MPILQMCINKGSQNNFERDATLVSVSVLLKTPWTVMCLDKDMIFLRYLQKLAYILSTTKQSQLENIVPTLAYAHFASEMIKDLACISFFFFFF